MQEKLVPVRVFNNRLEADLARDLLEEQGIYSFVSADDAGGFDPALQLSQGVRLMVREHDHATADQILHDSLAV